MFPDAYHRYKDDVAEETKQRRLAELIDEYTNQAQRRAERLVGTEQLVLVESLSRRSARALRQYEERLEQRQPGAESGRDEEASPPLLQWTGRTDGNRRVMMPDQALLLLEGGKVLRRPIRRGDYVRVRITHANHHTLLGEPVAFSCPSRWVAHGPC